MKNMLKVISFGSLTLMLVAAVLVFAGRLERTSYLVGALIGTVGWFASVPFWMKRGLHQSE
jgi:hypothetical protein